MALLKSIPTQYGVNAEYWRILRINSSFNGETEVSLAGYKDQAARDSGANPLDIRTISLPTQDGGRDVYYPELIKSKIQTRFIGVDENNQPIEEEYESNDFINAQQI